MKPWVKDTYQLQNRYFWGGEEGEEVSAMAVRTPMVIYKDFLL